MNRHTSMKVAVSLPAKTLRSVELERKRLGRSRSSIVAEALGAWLVARGSTDADRQYLAGYERHPEAPEDAVATAIMTTWDSWDEGAPVIPKTRRRRSR